MLEGYLEANANTRFLEIGHGHGKSHVCHHWPLSPIVAVQLSWGLLSPAGVVVCGVYTVAMPYLIRISRWFRTS